MIGLEPEDLEHFKIGFIRFITHFTMSLIGICVLVFGITIFLFVLYIYFQIY